MFNDFKKYLNLASVFSLIALFLSLAGIFLLLDNKFYLSFGLVMIAFIIDFLDGHIARKFKMESDFGRQLDSQIDVFIYLVYPALSFYLFFGLKDTLSLIIIGLFLVSGIFRLIRFNIEGYKESLENKAYVGLPVVFSHLLLIIFIILKVSNFPYFKPLADVLIIADSFLMVQNFSFPKPKKILFFIILLLLISLIMFYLASHEINKL